MIQAAKLVDVDTGEEIDASRATMERPTTCSSDAQAGTSVDGTTLITSALQTDSSRGKRANRVVGAGVTREVHNKLEKNRRAHLKICFEDLRRQLPGLEDKKASNLNILKNAILCIEQLKKKDREFELEANQLRRLKRMKQEELRVLKNEIGQDVASNFLRQTTEEPIAVAEEIQTETIETTLQSSTNDQQTSPSTSTVTLADTTVYIPVQSTVLLTPPQGFAGTRWHSHVGPSAGMATVLVDQQTSPGLLSKQ